MRKNTLFLGLLLATTAAGCGGGAGTSTGLGSPASGGSDAGIVRPLVQGRIVFASEENVALSNATVDLQLVDSGGVGRPACLVAGQRMYDVMYQGNSAAGEGLPFVISGKKPGVDGHFFVSVLIDVDSDGKLGPGDYQSRENPMHTAALFQNSDPVTVTVEKVQ